MYLRWQRRIQEAAREFVRRQYGAEASIVANQPPHAEMGDLALPLAMELARKLRRAPRQIAEEIAAELRTVPGVAKAEVAGAGYVNLFLDRGAYVAELGAASETEMGPAPGDGKLDEKLIVEHTNINPNKAAHIGHLRNAALGDTFVRLLRARGHTVEVQNYIDNTGVQVADVVVGFLHLEKKSESEVARLAADPGVRFDYYCWDLYARVTRFLEEDKTRLELRQRALQEIEKGKTEAARIAEVISSAIVRLHLRTMARLNVRYDLLPRESEILHLRFWDQAFELLQQKGAIYFETEGKNKGCWVMRQNSENPQISQITQTKEQANAAGSEEAAADETKVIVRSNGTVTYVGKDMAYQLWKFGLLERDFHYKRFEKYPDGRTVWVSSSEAGERDAPAFGHGQKVYNVIDVRQSYLQNIVAAGLRALGYEEQADRSIHFSYEMVALSPRCCEEMGIELSPEDRKRTFVEVSGRKGLGIKADDLVDRLIEEASNEVTARHPEKSEEARRRIAEQIAIGALRYFLLRYTSTTIIAFDFHEALSFEGETGPYVQYAAVRARNIFRKLEEEGGRYDEQAVTPAVLGRFLAAPEGDPFWELLYRTSQWEQVVETAIVTTEPAAVAKHAFQLAQAFNNFYHRFHILTEQDAEKKAFLLWLVAIVGRHLTATLDLLGIEVPEAM